MKSALGIVLESTESTNQGPHSTIVFTTEKYPCSSNLRCSRVDSTCDCLSPRPYPARKWRREPSSSSPTHLPTPTTLPSISPAETALHQPAFHSHPHQVQGRNSPWSWLQVKYSLKNYISSQEPTPDQDLLVGKKTLDSLSSAATCAPSPAQPLYHP